MHPPQDLFGIILIRIHHPLLNKIVYALDSFSADDLKRSKCIINSQNKLATCPTSSFGQAEGNKLIC